MARIISKEVLSEGLYGMTVYAPRVARKAMPGQFVILRPTDDSERIPLTISAYDREAGTVSVIFQAVGLTTKLLAALGEGGDIRDFVGPLGRASELDGVRRALCIGGGVGTAVILPQIAYLHERGAYVDVIEGARTKALVILEDALRAHCDNLYIMTDDGSYGEKGLVTDALTRLLEGGAQYDTVIAIGPPIMMKAVCAATRPYGLKTIVSLNPIMVDGTGMCGGCRVTVGGRTRYACVDGPDFDGHEVDFDELMTRLRFYREEEHDKQAACLYREADV